MLEQQPIDVKQILNGLNKLAELLEQPVTKESLSLETNIETTAQSDNLARLQYSLTQYKERGRDLLYVGFMGHFSAGKSSTINSLLGLTKQKIVRETDLNPTDKQITLITHEDNKKAVLIPTRENLVPIRAEFIDNPLLHNIVLADTPGTGDPLLIKEMARDFLPICDLILYCFSATNALDHTDIPILREKYSQLEFIPMRFLITRADEFEIEKKKLTEENFDEEKADKFLRELARRLQETIGFPIDHREDFFLIDNIEGFNIPQLRVFLQQMAQPDGVNQRINLHSHKIHYFRSSAKLVRDFFEQFLQEKVAILNSIVDEAEKNISEYQNVIQITNNDMTLNWEKHLKNIETLGDKCISTIAPIEYERDDLKSVVFSKNIRVLEKSLDDSTENLLLKYRDSIQVTITSFLSQIWRKIEDDVEEVLNKDSVSEEAAQISVPAAELSLPTHLNDITPESKYIDQSKAIHQQGLDKLEARKQFLLENLRILQKNLQSLHPMLKQQKEINTAIESLNEDLEGFFRRVEIYRDGVFARKTREKISQVGIGRKLDDLKESDISTTNPEKTKLQARNRIFPTKEDSVNTYHSQYTELASECENIIQTVKATPLSVPTGIEEIPNDSLLMKNNREFHKSLESQVKEEINKHISGNVTEINKALQLETTSYHRKIQSLQSDHLYASMKVIGSVIGICVFIYFLVAIMFIDSIDQFTDYLNHGLGLEGPAESSNEGESSQEAYPEHSVINDNEPNQSDLSQQPIKGTTVFNILAVLAGLFGLGIGYLINKKWNSFPRRKDEALSQYIQNIEIKMKSIGDQITIYKPLTQTDDLTQLLATLWKNLLIDAPFNRWQSQGNEFLAAVKVSESDYMDLRQQYISLVEEITEELSSYFREPNKNIEYLFDIASNIRSKAIEPSFNLLEETRDQLEDVRNELSQIDFV